MRLMMKTPRLKERPIAHWLRSSFIIRGLYGIGGGNFLTSHPHVFDRKSESHSLFQCPKLALLCLFLGTFTLFVTTSCEKSLDASVRDEGHPVLYEYYHEATGLYRESVDADSVFRFSAKVDGYTSAYPESKQTSYYPEIENCIKQRLATLGITFVVEDDWQDTVYIDFKFCNTKYSCPQRAGDCYK